MSNARDRSSGSVEAEIVVEVRYYSNGAASHAPLLVAATKRLGMHFDQLGPALKRQI